MHPFFGNYFRTKNFVPSINQCLITIFIRKKNKKQHSKKKITFLGFSTLYVKIYKICQTCHNS